jgi:hypothetical protein
MGLSDGMLPEQGGDCNVRFIVNMEAKRQLLIMAFRNWEFEPASCLFEWNK